MRVIDRSNGWITETEERQLDEFVERYYPKIFRYCLFHTDSREEAEDCTQETMIKTIRYCRDDISESGLHALVYKIAKNICIDHSRRRRAEVSLDSDGWDHLVLSYEVSLTDEEETLLSYTGSLSDELREVILLRFGQDLTIREIAELTGVPLRTAQSRLNRAIKLIRKELSDES
ncbi:MAG: RNA polymerase sigma factor [Solobacterium sp.]|nr:RNA polymerase sigma factor [Solobacterium sp.]